MIPRPIASCVLPGRFQPFHNGHAAVLEHALSQYDRVIVAISNAHISHTPNNPFTGGERFEMIDEFVAASAVADRVVIIPVAVDDEPTTWVTTLQAICPPFQEVYTRSPWTQSHFEYWGIRCSPRLLTGHFASGSMIRQKMASGGDWRPLVRPPVALTIDRFNGQLRVQRLAEGSNHRRSEIDGDRRTNEE